MEIPSHITVPQGIELKQSEVDASQIGAWCMKAIPKDTIYGPFVGEIVFEHNDKKVDYRFAWEVFDLERNELSHIVNATDQTKGNWMRYVNCARYLEEQNIVSVQEGDEVYYKAIKDIEQGDELLTWFQPFKKRRRRRKKCVDGKSPESEPHTPVKTKSQSKVKCPSKVNSPSKFKSTNKHVQYVVATAAEMATSSTPSKSPAMSSLEMTATATESSVSMATSSVTMATTTSTAYYIDSPVQILETKRQRKKKKLFDEEILLTDLVFKKKRRRRSKEEMERDAIEAALNAKNKVKRKRGRKKKSETILEEVPPQAEHYEEVEDREGREFSPVKSSSVLENLDEVEGKTVDSIEKSWSYAPKQMEYQFYLHPHFGITQYGRRAYRCDVCSGVYRHTFSLKRHYLRNHVNCRYLSRADITNCMILIGQQQLAIIKSNEKEMLDKVDETLSKAFETGKSNDVEKTDDNCEDQTQEVDGLIIKTESEIEADNNENKDAVSESVKESVEDHKKNCEAGEKGEFDADVKNEEETVAEESSKEDKNDGSDAITKCDLSMPGLYKCNICYRLYNEIEALKLHTHDHPKVPDVKGFACDCCDMRFTYKQNLVRHQMVHEGESVSTVNSASATMKKKGKQLDKKVPVIGKPFKCPRCPMKFKYTTNLERHEKLHFVDHSFICSYCGKGFPSATNMKKHEHIHLGSRVTCKYCTALFVHVGSLRKHIRLEHPDIHRQRLLKLLEKRGKLGTKAARTLQDSYNKDASNSDPGTKEESLDVAKRIKKIKESHASVREEMDSKFKFSCVICKKRFSSYVNMCRHRRLAHKDEHHGKNVAISTSSVVEDEAQSPIKPKRQMSRLRLLMGSPKPDTETIVFETANDPIDNSPEAAANFYANVAANIAENLTSYIDGGEESMAKFKQHIRIKDYDSVFTTEKVEDGPQEEAVNEEFLWEKFNFPKNYDPKVLGENFMDLTELPSTEKDDKSEIVSDGMFENKAPALCTRRRTSREGMPSTETSCDGLECRHFQQKDQTDAIVNVKIEPVDNNMDSKDGRMDTKGDSLNEEDKTSTEYGKEEDKTSTEDGKEEDKTSTEDGKEEDKTSTEDGKEEDKTSNEDDKEEDKTSNEGDKDDGCLLGEIKAGEKSLEKQPNMLDDSPSEGHDEGREEGKTVLKLPLMMGASMTKIRCDNTSSDSENEVSAASNNGSENSKSENKGNSSYRSSCHKHPESVVSNSSDNHIPASDKDDDSCHGNKCCEAKEDVQSVIQQGMKCMEETHQSDSKESCGTTVQDIDSCQSEKVQTETEQIMDCDLKAGEASDEVVAKEAGDNCCDQDNVGNVCDRDPNSADRLMDPQCQGGIDNFIKSEPDDKIETISHGEEVPGSKEVIKVLDEVKVPTDQEKASYLDEKVSVMKEESNDFSETSPGYQQRTDVKVEASQEGTADEKDVTVSCTNDSSIKSRVSRPEDDHSTCEYNKTEVDCYHKNSEMSSMSDNKGDCNVKSGTISGDKVGRNSSETLDATSSLAIVNVISGADPKDLWCNESLGNSSYDGTEDQGVRNTSGNCGDLEGNEGIECDKNSIINTGVDLNGKDDNRDDGNNDLSGDENNSGYSSPGVYNPPLSSDSEPDLDLGYYGSGIPAAELIRGLNLAKARQNWQENNNVGTHDDRVMSAERIYRNLLKMEGSQCQSPQYSPIGSPTHSPQNNFDSIAFGKFGKREYVCALCKRHFQDHESVLRHQWKKHPLVSCHTLEVEVGHNIEYLYYTDPTNVGVLGACGKALEKVMDRKAYTCTRCNGSFKNIDRLHIHIMNCAPKPAMVTETFDKLPLKRKRTFPRKYMGMELEQRDPASNEQDIDELSRKYIEKLKAQKKIFLGFRKRKLIETSVDSNTGNTKVKRRRSYDIGYNPGNHVRRREMTELLDTHQCKGCGVKFKSISLLERHVRKCDGKEKFKDLKVMKSTINESFHKKHKQICLYCQRGFAYPKTLMNHYKAFCIVKKEKITKGTLTEAERVLEADMMVRLKQQDEDRNEIVSVHHMEEGEGHRKGWPKGLKRKSRRKNHCWTYIKKRKSSNDAIDDDVSDTDSTSKSSRKSEEFSLPRLAGPAQKPATSPEKMDEVSTKDGEETISRPTHSKDDSSETALMIKIEPLEYGEGVETHPADDQRNDNKVIQMESHCNISDNNAMQNKLSDGTLMEKGMPSDMNYVCSDMKSKDLILQGGIKVKQEPVSANLVKYNINTVSKSADGPMLTLKPVVQVMPTLFSKTPEKTKQHASTSADEKVIRMSQKSQPKKVKTKKSDAELKSPRCVVATEPVKLSSVVSKLSMENYDAEFPSSNMCSHPQSAVTNDNITGNVEDGIASSKSPKGKHVKSKKYSKATKMDSAVKNIKDTENEKRTKSPEKHSVSSKLDPMKPIDKEKKSIPFVLKCPVIPRVTGRFDSPKKASSSSPRKAKKVGKASEDATTKIWKKELKQTICNQKGLSALPSLSKLGNISSTSNQKGASLISSQSEFPCKLEKMSSINKQKGPSSAPSSSESPGKLGKISSISKQKGPSSAPSSSESSSKLGNISSTSNQKGISLISSQSESHSKLEKMSSISKQNGPSSAPSPSESPSKLGKISSIKKQKGPSSVHSPSESPSKLGEISSIGKQKGPSPVHSPSESPSKLGKMSSINKHKGPSSAPSSSESHSKLGNISSVNKQKLGEISSIRNQKGHSSAPSPSESPSKLGENSTIRKQKGPSSEPNPSESPSNLGKMSSTSNPKGASLVSSESECPSKLGKVSSTSNQKGSSSVPNQSESPSKKKSSTSNEKRSSLLSNQCESQSKVGKSPTKLGKASSIINKKGTSPVSSPDESTSHLKTDSSLSYTSELQMGKILPKNSTIKLKYTKIPLLDKKESTDLNSPISAPDSTKIVRGLSDEANTFEPYKIKNEDQLCTKTTKSGQSTNSTNPQPLKKLTTMLRIKVGNNKFINILADSSTPSGAAVTPVFPRGVRSKTGNRSASVSCGVKTIRLGINKTSTSEDKTTGGMVNTAKAESPSQNDGNISNPDHQTLKKQLKKAAVQLSGPEVLSNTDGMFVKNESDKNNAETSLIGDTETMIGQISSGDEKSGCLNQSEKTRVRKRKWNPSPVLDVPNIGTGKAVKSVRKRRKRTPKLETLTTSGDAVVATKCVQDSAKHSVITDQLVGEDSFGALAPMNNLLQLARVATDVLKGVVGSSEEDCLPLNKTDIKPSKLTTTQAIVVSEKGTKTSTLVPSHRRISPSTSVQIPMEDTPLLRVKSILSKGSPASTCGSVSKTGLSVRPLISSKTSPRKKRVSRSPMKLATREELLNKCGMSAHTDMFCNVTAAKEQAKETTPQTK